MVRPGRVQVAVHFEAFGVGNVEFLTPASQCIASCVRAEPASMVGDFALLFKPPKSQLDGISDVVFGIASLCFPSRVVPDVTSSQTRVVKLETRDGTSGVPPDLDCRVSVPVEVSSEVCRRGDVTLSGTQAHAPNPPWPGSLFVAAKLASTPVELRCLPAFAHVDGMVDGKLHASNVFFRAATEHRPVISDYVPNSPFRQGHASSRSPRLCESSLELFRRWNLSWFRRIRGATLRESLEVEGFFEQTFDAWPILFATASFELIRVSQRLTDVLELVRGDSLGLIALEEDSLRLPVGHVAFCWPAPHDSVMRIFRVESPGSLDVHFL